LAKRSNGDGTIVQRRDGRYLGGRNWRPDVSRALIALLFVVILGGTVHTCAAVLPHMLARGQVRYPEIAIVFLETRPLAEEWTFRYLGAALAEFESEQRAGSQLRAAELPLDYATVRPPPSKRRQTEGA